MPKRLFVCKAGEFTEFSILLDKTWTMFRFYHNPTEKMVSWIEDDVDFFPLGIEIQDLQSSGDKLLACVKLMAAAEEMNVRFEVLSEHFTEVPEITKKDENPPPVMSRYSECCEPGRKNPTEF